MARNKLLHNQNDTDPMGEVPTLFAVAMVFAVALMVALVSRFNMTEIFSKEDYTMVKNPGQENMEIITKEGKEIKRYTPSEQKESSGKRGKKVGVAYELENGKIIYVPECGEKKGLIRIFAVQAGIVQAGNESKNFTIDYHYETIQNYRSRHWAGKRTRYHSCRARRCTRSRCSGGI